MTQIVTVEKSTRGPLGKLAKWLFIIFNGLMALWFVIGLGAASETVATADSEAEQAGAAIGTVLGAGMIMFVWLCGAVILGLFALLTRGQRTVVYRAAGSDSPELGVEPAPGPGVAPPNSNRSAVGAWIVSVLFFIAALGSALGQDFAAGIGFVLVGLCAFPPLWRQPAVARLKVPVWARWVGALLFLAAVGSAAGGEAEIAAPKAVSPGTEQSTAAPMVERADNWSVNEEVSPLDDSRNVYASVDATNKIKGWLSSERPSLMTRCKEGKLEAYIDTKSQLTSDYDLYEGQRTRVKYRVGTAPTVTVWASESSDGNAFFIPSPRTFISQLRGADRFVVEYTPFQAGMGTATFSITGADAALAKVLAACSG
ncbi:MAG TPA: hypothetical protein VFX95_04505 [Caulobacteraceae bacterium]|nr:hypothetical protein [Caulobacteraceae bacterium]